MIFSDFLSRMEGEKSDPHEVIPISFDSPSILTGHCHTFSNLPYEIYRVVTICHTKMAATQMPKVHGPFKAVNPKHKPETKPIPVVPRSVPQPEMRIPPVLPRKRQEE